MNDSLGNLKDNVSLIKATSSSGTAANVSNNKNPPVKGTIADGISKLLIVANYDKPLEFSLKANSNNVLNDNSSLTTAGGGRGLGSLNSLVRESSNTRAATDTVLINPQKDKTGKLIVAAVYTPPTYVNPPANTDHIIINVQVTDISSNDYK